MISTEVGGDNGSLADELRTNIPPDLKVEGEKKRTVKVGQPLTLVGDRRRSRQPAGATRRQAAAGREERRDRPATDRERRAPEPPAPPNSAAVVYRPPVAVVASSGPGLRFSWIVYRGKASAVTFTPDQMKTWMDTRAYGNSRGRRRTSIPEPPADGRWNADVVFSEPGTYVLRGVASDGSLFTYENVTVTVTP